MLIKPSTHGISFNKRPRRLSNFETLGCGVYLKVKIVIHRKFQNFVIVSFRMTINYYCDTQTYIKELLVISIVSLLHVYILI